MSWLRAGAVVLYTSLQLQISTDTLHLQCLQSEARLESCRTSAVGFFCRNSQRVKAVACFRKRVPSCIFDRILNATLPDKLL